MIKQKNKNLDIMVVATMSSGKSTFINSIIGREIIPSKNEACTAKICKIVNDKTRNDFCVFGLDKYKNKVFKYTSMNLECMDYLNDNEDILMSEIIGNIENLDTYNGMSVTIVDTPGPNNSQDITHSKITIDTIKNITDDTLVLYVINATQIGVDDDYNLLRLVRDEVYLKGGQDRVIFILNKIDQIDLQKESIEQVIINTKEYLKNSGVEEPYVYPASSYIAKNIRKVLSGEHVTKKEQRSFYDVDDLDLLKYVPLNNSSKDELQDEIDLCIKNRDEERELLYYTGIPYIEKAINDYIRCFVNIN
ncbi:MAG: dynamin family protein [Peptostreptococcaceae bacterium]